MTLLVVIDHYCSCYNRITVSLEVVNNLWNVKTFTLFLIYSYNFMLYVYLTILSSLLLSINSHRIFTRHCLLHNIGYTFIGIQITFSSHYVSITIQTSLQLQFSL